MLLDQLLGGLDISVNAFAICEVRREASLVLQDEDSVSVHYVLDGRGHARPMGGPAFDLEPHTVIIAPPGGAPEAADGKAGGGEGEIRAVRLPNGLRVLIKRHAHLPMVNVQAFVLGASLLIIIGELGDFSGYDPTGANDFAEVINWFANIR